VTRAEAIEYAATCDVEAVQYRATVNGKTGYGPTPEAAIAAAFGETLEDDAR
jgi:hypothetical protein